MQKKTEFTPEQLHFLRLLGKQYPTVQAAGAEIINLQAIMNLPKGTEHFISDIHGEYEAFLHLLNSCSGVIREKLDELFATTLSQHDRNELATLIYYPEEKLALVAEEAEDLDEWYRITLYRLLELCRFLASKYTRSKVRHALPQGYADVIDELLHIRYEEPDKRDYYDIIISTIIDIGQAAEVIQAICQVIKRLAVDHMHIVGDILRPRPPGGCRDGFPAGLPQRGYPVGQSRYSLDGRRLRLPGPGGDGVGKFHSLQQPRCH